MLNRQDNWNFHLSSLNDRKTWEERQRTWYQMRHNGIRRARKPGPWASDMHYPLADTIISKLKPYYFEQLYAPEQLATFVSLKPQATRLTTGTARWFDFQLKQRSNLEMEILAAIDLFLNGGRSAIKACWNPKTKQIEYHAINSLHLVVPRNAVDTCNSGAFAHIRVLSRQDYLDDPNFTNKSDEFINSISGSGAEDKSGDLTWKQEKFRREGITYGATKNEIIVWECYQKNESGKWVVETYSPLVPNKDLRDTFEFPYAYGEPTFVDFTYEVKDKGWYSSRGICELVAPHEASLCRLWNDKHDCMTLYNRPMFTSDQEIPNSANIEMHPGQILPFNLKAVQSGSPPISFDQEMMSTRQIAEQRIAMPDFGMNQVMNTSDRRTAAEVHSINEVMGNSNDLRARIFRKSLGKLYRMSWALLKEFKSKDLAYFYKDEALTLDAEALGGEYDIMPHGSADGVSKVFNQQKAVQRFQMFNNDPFINQMELRRSVLENDDSSLSQRLLVDPGTAQADQQEDQADEISVLNIGFKARVKPMDDHAIHIQTCLEYLQSREALGVVFNPISEKAVREHIMEHIEALRESDPKLARQIEKAITNMMAPQPQPAVA